jgi:hypothetical protein
VQAKGRDIQSCQGVWHLRIEDKREKIRYIPLAIVAQRLISAHLDAAKHGDETDGPLFRPVKNKATGSLAKPPAQIVRVGYGQALYPADR